MVTKTGHSIYLLERENDVATYVLYILQKKMFKQKNMMGQVFFKNNL